MTNGAKRSFSFAWRLMLLRLGCLLTMVDAFFFLLHSFASIFLLLFFSVLVQILVSGGDALFFLVPSSPLFCGLELYCAVPFSFPLLVMVGRLSRRLLHRLTVSFSFFLLCVIFHEKKSKYRGSLTIH